MTEKFDSQDFARDMQFLLYNIDEPGSNLEQINTLFGNDKIVLVKKGFLFFKDKTVIGFNDFCQLIALKSLTNVGWNISENITVIDYKLFDSLDYTIILNDKETGKEIAKFSSFKRFYAYASLLRFLRLNSKENIPYKNNIETFVLEY